MQQDYSHAAPQQTHHVRRSLGLIYIIPLGLVIGFLLFVVSYFLRTRNTTAPEPTTQTAILPSATPTPLLEETPTAVQLPENDTAIRILNGSGVAGAAGKIEEELKDYGYTNTKTGNAGVYTYKDITIQASSGKKAEAETLKEVLEKTHTVGEITKPASGSATEITIIVGK